MIHGSCHLVHGSYKHLGSHVYVLIQEAGQSGDPSAAAEPPDTLQLYEEVKSVPKVLPLVHLVFRVETGFCTLGGGRDPRLFVPCMHLTSCI